MTPDDPNATEERGNDSGVAPESGAGDATSPQDAASAAPQEDVSSNTGRGGETLSQEEMLGLQSQLAERGIDLGSLVGAMLTQATQTQPKPKPAQAASAKKEDPATLLGKLAESLGLSPAALAKQLGPAIKELLAAQGSSAKPKKAKKKPAAKPKPASKPKKTAKKPAAKPKPAAKRKPASKPKPKPAAKPKSSASSKPRPKKKTT